MYNFISLNFGEIEADRIDLWDCLKTNALNVLFSSDHSEVYFQISDDCMSLVRCDCLESAFLKYAEFINTRGIMGFSSEFLVGLIQCVYDEDIDGMYQIIAKQGGNIEFFSDADDLGFSEGALNHIALEYPYAPFCMLQSAEAEVSVEENKITYNGNLVELKELFGCIDNFDARSCVYTMHKLI